MKSKKEVARLSATVLLIGFGAVFVAVGAYKGEMAIVMRKAVMLCLECIGVG